MPRVQLNVRVDAALAKRLRKAAEARDTFPGVLVAQAIELLLSGNSKAQGQALSAPSSDLAAALAALEQRVALLEQGAAQPSPKRGSPERVKPSPEKGSPIPQTGEAPAGAITTIELAERTGTNRGAWNNWAADERVGQVRSHPQAGPWRLVGKGPGPNGGPDRWLWEPAG